MEDSERTELRQQLDQQMKKPMAKGDTWFLVNSRWFELLSSYIGLESRSTTTDVLPQDHPGPIDNSPLFLPDGSLREHLVEEMDYKLLPVEAWNLLLQRFGITSGQEPIERKVIEHGLFVKGCKVEVYLLEINLALLTDPQNTKKVRISKSDTIANLYQRAREAFDLSNDDDIRLWQKYTHEASEYVANSDKAVQDSGFHNQQTVLIERKAEDGTWTKAIKGVNEVKGAVSGEVSNSTNSNDTNASKTSGSSNAVVPVAPVLIANPSSAPISTRYNYGSYGEGSSTSKAQPGLCGLSNLGNTCFMNSIIQGLSNCPPITEYFANDNYVEDINESNPLGMRGEIARAFGELIKAMWSGKYSYFVPRNFKMAVGRFAPQFSGYHQQDSQELLTFLLDGLHEDLNRIKNKPYIELKDSNNRPDEEVAAEAWDTEKKRNDSVILDLFQGLLKSTVVCPECPKVSVTFDPFCYLSLPLPVKKERRMEVFVVFADIAKCPKQFKVTVAKDGCMKDLCEVLSKLSGCESSQLIVTDVYNHRFHKIYAPDELLSHILDRDDIFVYEVPKAALPDHVIVPVYLREKKSSSSYSPSNLFGQPLLIGVPKDGTTYERLYEIVLKHMGRFVSAPNDQNPEASTWWKPSIVPSSDEKAEETDGNIMVNGTTTNGTTNGSGSDNQADNHMSSHLSDDDEMAVEEDDGRGPPKLFVINAVNTYGNAQVEQLRNDGSPLTLSSKTYLSLDWHSKAKELFYNEKMAEECTQDSSFDSKPMVKKQQVLLEDCLDVYTTKEKLGENDAWYCPSCKKHQQATKKFDIWSLPALLVISLKRFSYNRYLRDKLDTHVEFPIKGLDMSPYVINKNHGNAVYDLVAVSNHYGGMGGGHYTAYAINKDDGKWYYFDDASVKESDESCVVSKAAYVLFYQRRDLMGQMPLASSRLAASSTISTCNGQDGLNGEAFSDDAMDTN